MTEPQRRRLESPAKDTGGRSGCLLLGAVLGIVAGAIFAFYGLPPILRSIYGETKVAVGDTYRGDAKEVRVLEVNTATAGRVELTVVVRTNKTWQPQPSDFQIELSSGGDWIKAAAPGDSVPETNLDFGLGVERTLLLVFPLPAGATGSPKALHLSNPRVRFALAP